MNTCKRQRTIPTMSEEQWPYARDTILVMVRSAYCCRNYEQANQVLTSFYDSHGLSNDMYEEMVVLEGRCYTEVKFQLREEEYYAAMDALGHVLDLINKYLAKFKLRVARSQDKSEYKPLIQLIKQLVDSLYAAMNDMWMVAEMPGVGSLENLNKLFCGYLTHISMCTRDDFDFYPCILEDLTRKWREFYPGEITQLVQGVETAITAKRAELAARV